MARCQGTAMWIWLLILWCASCCMCCHTTSKQLHICLNIYLERDFFHIETLVKGQESPTGYGGGRFYVEGPELESICGHFAALIECYEKLLMECDTYWKIDRYSRMMKVVAKTHEYLCRNSTDNIRDLLLNAACIKSATPQLAPCSNNGFHWSTTWKEVLRLQVDPADRCVALDSYKTCMVDTMEAFTCGQTASKVYADLMDVWLDEWCNRSGTSENSQRSFFYLALFYGYGKD